jgi:hypothetical protein
MTLYKNIKRSNPVHDVSPKAALANVPNTGDVGTDALISALVSALDHHGAAKSA